MRRVVCFVLAMVLAIPSFSFAEDFNSMTIEELEERRNEVFTQLTEINRVLSEKRTHNSQSLTSLSGETTIESLFADENLALYIRDKLGKLSIKDKVTQDELDSITSIWMVFDGDVYDLSGISHLRFLKSLSITPFKGTTLTNELLELPFLTSFSITYYKGTTLPEWFTQLTKLEYLELTGSSLVKLPDDLGNLTNLTYIMLNNSYHLTELPISIGQLTKLTELHCGGTGLKSIPDTLGNCANLKILEVAYTDISDIPSSVLALNMEKLDISNTKIK